MEQVGAARRYTDPELAAEAREGFDEDITTEPDFQEFLDAWWPELTPRGVLAAMADERLLGRWARRVLTSREVRQLARSLQRLDHTGHGPLSVHDVALLDELQMVLGAPMRPARPREADPLDHLTGLEELTTYTDRNGGGRSRRERLEEERTDYAHVIVDEAQDLTPMQWRMVGRRGRTRPGRSSATPRSPPGPTRTRPPWPVTRRSAPARAAASRSP